MLDGPDPFTGIMAGFECATQLRRAGGRHDFVAATRHDVLASEDYALLRACGIASARDGLRWHLIETSPGRYDWSSLSAQRDGAAKAGIAVAWDLLHYGWPDWLDPLDPQFVSRFADFAAAAAAHLGPGGFYTPVNEISFMAWAGGEVAYFAPFRTDCADALKTIFCRAAIAGARAIRAIDPGATILTSEPLIHVAPASPGGGHASAAAHMRIAQHEAALILLGRLQPELGGAADLFDRIGLNYYPHNQFDSRRQMLPHGDGRRRPLHRMLADAQALYGKPLFLSETGAEDEARASWLTDTCEEVRRANARGADARAVCLYPILNHLGWDDGRYCAHGLFCGVEDHREIHRPLADRIAAEQARGLGLAAAPDGAPADTADWAPDFAGAIPA